MPKAALVLQPGLAPRLACAPACWALVALAALCSGCAGGETRSLRPVQPVPPATPSSPALLLRDAGWGRIQLEPLALSLSLPDAAAWRDAGGHDWHRLEHAPTSSLLSVTRFRAPASVAAGECAVRAGLDLTANSADEANAVEVRPVEGQPGTHSELVVRVEPDGPTALRGEVVAATAGFRACAALRFETRVDGDGREVEVARRLAVFAERVVPSLAFDRIEDRIKKKSDPIGL
jgi:hypothetical protein